MAWTATRCSYRFEREPIKAQHGVADFLPRLKAHPAIVIKDLAGNLASNHLAGHPVRADDPQDGNTWSQLTEPLTSGDWRRTVSCAGLQRQTRCNYECAYLGENCPAS